MRYWMILIALVAGLATGVSSVAAQPQRPSVNPYENVLRRPSVSPYLNLLRDDGSGVNNVPNYQTIVRPLIDQRQTNQQQAAAVRNLQRQLSQSAQVQRSRVAGPSPSSIARPTGHAARFMVSPYYNNLSHYYGQPLTGP